MALTKDVGIYGLAKVKEETMPAMTTAEGSIQPHEAKGAARHAK